MRKRHILFLILALVLAVGIFASAQASVTTEKSGPAIGKHQPQAYVFNVVKDTITNTTTGKRVSEKGINDMPVLYGGDTLEFRYGSNKLYWVFVDSKGDYTASPPPGADGKTRIKVLGTAKVAWGDVTLTVITKIKITGNDIVQLNNGTFASGGGISLFVLKYAYGPRWCDIKTECWFQRNNDHHKLPATQLAKAGYYTKEKSSTRAWAEDSLKNGYGKTHKEVILTLRRPYVEGLLFSGIGFDSKTGKHQLSKEYRIIAEEGHGNIWEGWKDNQVEVHTELMKTGGNYDGYPAYEHSSYDDMLLVRFIYTYGRTLTFDARGGTIDGYATRIYEAEGRQFFNQDLQSGKVDKLFAAGKAYVPVRKGYFFEGWYEDSSYKKPVTSIKDTVNKYDGGSEKASKRICRLYAKWSPIVSVKDCKIDEIPDQVYTGSAIKPALTVKYSGKTLVKGTDYTVSFADNVEPGKATVTITGKNAFKGQTTVTFRILPKKVKLVSLKAGKTKLTVTWKKGTAITGYEIGYSTNKDFSKSKTVTVAGASTVTAKIPDLKPGKTYYVRIRTYKKVGTKMYYSDWSDKMKATMPEE